MKMVVDIDEQTFFPSHEQRTPAELHGQRPGACLARRWRSLSLPFFLLLPPT